MKPKPKERLADHVLWFIRRTLTDNMIPYENTIQHGDGTINTDSVVVGDLSVAVMKDGRVEVCDESGGPTNGTHRWFDAGEMDEMLNCLMAGRLNDHDQSATG